MSVNAEHASAASIPGLLVDRAAQDAGRRGVQFRDGYGWASLTWAQAEDRVRALAAGLIELGIGGEDRVAILSGTRVEWILADLAILRRGRRDHHDLPVEHPGRVRVRHLRLRHAAS